MGVWGSELPDPDPLDEDDELRWGSDSSAVVDGVAVVVEGGGGGARMVEKELTIGVEGDENDRVLCEGGGRGFVLGME